MSRRARAAGAGAVLVALVALGGVHLVRSHVSYTPQPWTGRVLGVAQTGQRLDLIGIDPASAGSARLARLDVAVDRQVAPDAAVVARGDGTSLLAVTRADGFAADVFTVDPTRRQVVHLGDVAAGRFPALRGDHLLGVQVRSGVATQVEYALPDLREVARAPVGLLPLAGGPGCLAGSTAQGSAALVRRSSPGLLTVPGWLPGGGACSTGVLALSLSATAPPPDSRTTPEPGHLLAVARPGVPGTVQVDVGLEPLHVALDGDRAAVDVRSATAGRRAVALVDLHAGRVTATVDLPALQQVEAMTWTAGRLVVLGGETAVVVVPGRTTTTSADLPGSNLTYQPASAT